MRERAQHQASYGRWTVLRELPKKGAYRQFLCRCSCGRERAVYLKHLRSGLSTGCKWCPDKNGHLEDGEVFGRLTILKDEGSAKVKVQCICGTVKYASRSSLRRGEVVSCGCYNREQSRRRFTALGKSHGIPFTPARYHRLLALEEIAPGPWGRRIRCRCDCGQETVVYFAILRQGRTKSCGCLRTDNMREVNKRYKKAP